jgi:hypothetical protein
LNLLLADEHPEGVTIQSTYPFTGMPKTNKITNQDTFQAL